MSIIIFACFFDLHFRTNIKIYDINALQAQSIVVGLFEGLGKEPQLCYQVLGIWVGSDFVHYKFSRVFVIP